MLCNIYIYNYLHAIQYTIYIYILYVCNTLYIYMYVCMWVYTLWAGGNELIPVAAVLIGP